MTDPDEVAPKLPDFPAIEPKVVTPQHVKLGAQTDPDAREVEVVARAIRKEWASRSQIARLSMDMAVPLARAAVQRLDSHRANPARDPVAGDSGQG